jgi:Sec-independent protein translocase protein TatA
VSELGLNIDPAMQTVLGQLKELKKNISTGKQELNKDISANEYKLQDELKMVINTCQKNKKVVYVP